MARPATAAALCCVAPRITTTNRKVATISKTSAAVMRNCRHSLRPSRSSRGHAGAMTKSGCAAGDHVEDARAGERAEELRDPVHHHLVDAHAAGEPDAEGDGRVHMAARDRADAIGHRDDGETEGEGNRRAGRTARARAPRRRSRTTPAWPCRRTRRAAFSCVPPQGNEADDAAPVPAPAPAGFFARTTLTFRLQTKIHVCSSFVLHGQMSRDEIGGQNMLGYVTLERGICRAP